MDMDIDTKTQQRVTGCIQGPAERPPVQRDLIQRLLIVILQKSSSQVEASRASHGHRCRPLHTTSNESYEPLPLQPTGLLYV